jgi:hypothetical protein
MYVLSINRGIFGRNLPCPDAVALDPDQEVIDLRALVLLQLDLNQDGFLGDQTLCATEEATNESER